MSDIAALIVIGLGSFLALMCWWLWGSLERDPFWGDDGEDY